MSAKDSAGDPINRQAIIAFQKLNHLKRNGKLTPETIVCIHSATRPIASDSAHCEHLEVDLNNQVLFLVDSNDRVEHVLPVSTGNGKWFETEDRGGRYALTPRGHFKVYYKIAGWKKSPLGMLYYPLYIVSGVAIHGAQQVPPYPASHGCIRIPMYAAKALFQMVRIGTPALVFGENPKPQK